MRRELPPPKSDNPLALRPVYGPKGELIWHPDIPDMEKWKAEQAYKRWKFRRDNWGVLCWAWFGLVLMALGTGEKAKTLSHEGIREVLMIASGPLLVRGFWHRIQSGG